MKAPVAALPVSERGSAEHPVQSFFSGRPRGDHRVMKCRDETSYTREVVPRPSSGMRRDVVKRRTGSVAYRALSEGSRKWPRRCTQLGLM